VAPIAMNKMNGFFPLDMDKQRTVLDEKEIFVPSRKLVFLSGHSD
jgi:hypothetical protein